MTEIIFTSTADLVDLDSLPGGAELYEHLADVFLCAYNNYPPGKHPKDCEYCAKDAERRERMRSSARSRN